MIDIQTLLMAIAMVESGSRDYVVGRNGERSRYQIMERTWKQHSSIPFKDHARSPSRSYKVAESHIAWLRARMPENKMAKVKEVALAWKVGLTNWKQGVWFPNDEDYAKRVANLYTDSVARRTQVENRIEISVNTTQQTGVHK
jgi:hypothetical protein